MRCIRSNLEEENQAVHVIIEVRLQQKANLRVRLNMLVF
jgi:hypothetical protein